MEQVLRKKTEKMWTDYDEKYFVERKEMIIE